MIDPTAISKLPHWQQRAYEHFVQGDYVEASVLYEQAIAESPKVPSYYWHLGLTQFLQNQQADAETTWFLPMLEQDEATIEQMRSDLAEVLLIEIDRQVNLKHFQTALSLCSYVQELTPKQVDNFLKVIRLRVKLGVFDKQDAIFSELIELLNSEYPIEFDAELMLSVIKTLLNKDLLSDTPYTLAKVCLPYAEQMQALVSILREVQKKIQMQRSFTLANAYSELCFGFEKLTPSSLEFLSRAYIFSKTSLQLAIDLTKLAYHLSQETHTSVISHRAMLLAMIDTGSGWAEAIDSLQEHKQLLLKLTSQPCQEFERNSVLGFFYSAFAVTHLEDNPSLNRPIYNRVTHLCQTNLERYHKEYAERYRQCSIKPQKNINERKNIRIGYLSANLKRHPIGFLARWLLQYHDRNQFEIYTYHINYSTSIVDPLQNWYISQGSHGRMLRLDTIEIAEQIHQDDIDILIDLESTTMLSSCEVLALKPAPIQATWLGFDASGLPAIDYFIADPYVLPETAQDYYSEKIWRLPQTYLAIDGFEVVAPTLRRSRLDLPSDAVIFFSAQRANKRHPETIKLQMEIIKSVPNSYFLIKGSSNNETIQESFYEIASREGVSLDRLRFLPLDPSEELHRANLSIADVVLDTHPYNGATTTLEALWMGIPLVTKVGEQFSARNSYTFMVNANITEGIAWTDDEYIEWGIRLGTDEELRKQVHWKLLTSRQTAPLWNTRQFAREMENAYQQMWNIYTQQS
jgi:predicted O-linked N-acetylglucosamine transferase (SPINDLY family)